MPETAARAPATVVNHRHAECHRALPNGFFVVFRGMPEWGVEDQLDFAVLEQIHDVRTAPRAP